MVQKNASRLDKTRWEYYFETARSIFHEMTLDSEVLQDITECVARSLEPESGEGSISAGDEPPEKQPERGEGSISASDESPEQQRIMISERVNQLLRHTCTHRTIFCFLEEELYGRRLKQNSTVLTERQRKYVEHYTELADLLDAAYDPQNSDSPTPTDYEEEHRDLISRFQEQLTRPIDTVLDAPDSPTSDDLDALSDEQMVVIKEFIAATNAEFEDAENLLRRYDWDLNLAVEIFLDHREDPRLEPQVGGFDRSEIELATRHSLENTSGNAGTSSMTSNAKHIKDRPANYAPAGSDSNKRLALSPPDKNAAIREEITSKKEDADSAVDAVKRVTGGGLVSSSPNNKIEPGVNSKAEKAKSGTNDIGTTRVGFVHTGERIPLAASGQPLANIPNPQGSPWERYQAIRIRLQLQYYGRQIENNDSDPNRGIPREEKSPSLRTSANPELENSHGPSQPRVSGQMGPLEVPVTTTEPEHEGEHGKNFYGGSRDRNEYRFDDGQKEHGTAWGKRSSSPVEKNAAPTAQAERWLLEDRDRQQDAPPVASGQLQSEEHTSEQVMARIEAVGEAIGAVLAMMEANNREKAECEAMIAANQEDSDDEVMVDAGSGLNSNESGRDVDAGDDDMGSTGVDEGYLTGKDAKGEIEEEVSSPIGDLD
jgi:hypothetical protein